MQKKEWIEVTVKSDSSFQDLLIGQLAQLGFDGFLQEEASFSCYAPAKIWKNGMAKKLQSLLRNFEKEFKGTHFPTTKKTIHQRNWNGDWEKSVGIVEATSNIIIKPSWKKLRAKDKGKIVLHIDPKMAFGTGHHETTRLALVLLEDHLRADAQVLDFGSGTGILAIAAIRLGAKAALAIDNDPGAVENAVENISKNRVPRRVKTIVGDERQLPRRLFDIVLANIDLATISKSLAALAKRLKPDGIMIVSGLLTTQLTDFMNLISHQGVMPLEMVSENEWVAIALIKADATSLH